MVYAWMKGDVGITSERRNQKSNNLPSHGLEHMRFSFAWMKDGVLITNERRI